MINFREAQALLQQHARSFGTEKVQLEDALGRVLSQKITADRDYPPFNRSAMDGFAIRYDDFEKGIRRFEIAETIYAGSVNTKSLVSGQCYKIMTGAAVPAGADLVIRREDTEEAINVIQVLIENCRPFQNIALQGEDIKAGVDVISLACKCEPSSIGLLASLGKSQVAVQRLPQVALFTTGNEVVPVEVPVSPVQIRNSNRWVLQALLKKWGIVPSIYEHIPDDRQALRLSLHKAMKAEIIIISGGVSAGDADYVPQVLEESGVKKIFHKVAIKPGKPLWCGFTPGGMVFALPGNPFSCMVGFTLFIQPYLRSCFQLPDACCFYLPIQFRRKKKTNLDEFFPVQIAGHPAMLQPVAINGSGDIRLGLHAQAVALHPAESGDLPEGEILLCYSLI